MKVSIQTLPFDQRACFIAGQAKSGTTLMVALLDNHPELLVLPEMIGSHWFPAKPDFDAVTWDAAVHDHDALIASFQEMPAVAVVGSRPLEVDGRQLVRVRDVMRTGDANPVVREDASLREAAAVMTRTPGRPGAASVIDARGRLVGIFTDGDLRRLVQDGSADFGRPVSTAMGKNPRTVTPADLALVAADLLRERQVDQLPVVDEAGRPVGLLDVQDLLAARLFG